ncbi:hypothetical protein QIS74_03763 [Colletotrichum tabaci]|uniref:Uncharacterized protein n=1 Tax=Colletotrichum tabaci TaxID=1209068 RepID=A0AAV9TPF0_9PEZI
MKGKPLLILVAVAGIATAQVKLSSFTVSGSIYIGCAVLNNVATETFDFPVSGLTRNCAIPCLFQALTFRFCAAVVELQQHLYFDLHGVNFFIVSFTAVYLSYFFQRFSDKQRYFDIGVASLEPIGVPEQQYRGRTALFKWVQLGLSPLSTSTSTTTTATTTSSSVTILVTAADLVETPILITVKVIAAPSTGPATTLDA